MLRNQRHLDYQPGDETLCAGCAICCDWPGDVLFEPGTLPDIAAHLGLDERTCAETFFDLTENRWHLKVKPTAHGGCCFVSAQGCRVYPHRPQQCRTFPYTWRRTETSLMRQCRLYQAVRARNDNNR